MRFVDEAIITVRSGKGGRGCVSFRREKFIPKGGPDGGDGGDGGNVILRASSKLLSLYDFRLKRLYEAQNGQPGQGSQCNGRKGEDLYLDLPVGVQVYRLVDGKHGELLADLAEAGDEFTIAKGGIGGKGNEFFKSPTQRAPRFAQPGEEGEELTLGLSLKILADCGLLGLPNAGKSTFISKISAAKPKIAPYPFTTLEPNLGVMLDDGDYERRMVIADIPGLVEGAHQGTGLGHRFLKHVERTRFLVHLLSIEDINPDNPWAGFDLINNELASYDATLAERPQIQVINKIDLADEELLELLKQAAKKDNRKLFFISAKTGEGLEDLEEAMWEAKEKLESSEALSTFVVRKRKGREQIEEEVDDSLDDSDSADEFKDIEVFYVP